MAEITALVRAIRLEAQDIISLELTPANPTIEFRQFEPGSHIDLHLPNGLVRSYSLLNDSVVDSQKYVVAVLKDKNSRGGSKWIHDNIRVGMVLPISHPRNNFSLRPAKNKSVLVAGGIGITPMLSMLRSLLKQSNPVELIYCARSKVQAAFLNEIETLSKSNPGSIKVVYHFDEDKGSPPELNKLLAGNSSDTNFYCCGPSSMLSSFESACEEFGYGNVYIERFAAEQEVPVLAEGYVVELKKSNRVIQVKPGESILDALLDAGLNPQHSCRDGVCGACETKVLCGEVDHHDGILTKEERLANKSMMICVSHAKSKSITLDL